MGHGRTLGALVALTTAIMFVICGCASEPSTVSPVPTVTKTTQQKSGQHHDSGGSGQHDAGTTSQPQTSCPDGSTVPADQTCPTPVTTECPGGTTVTGTETCPTPVTCGNGSTVYPPQTCPTPTSCSDGSTVYSPQTCPTPPVKCPDGSTAPSSGDCPPLIHNQVAPGFTCHAGSGIVGPYCDCPSGWDYVGNNDGSNGKCVAAGAGAVPHATPLQPSLDQDTKMLSQHVSVPGTATRPAAPDTYSRKH